MKITRNNYEPWFLDYLEGNLDERMVDEFIEFIRRNPDLRDELQLFKPATNEEDHICFEGKAKLYKESFDLPAEFDNAAVAMLEGDMDPEQKILFENYLTRHPEKQSEMGLVRQIRLNPDNTVVFGLKYRLYHRPVLRQMMEWPAKVAAVILLIFTIYIIADQPGRHHENVITTLRMPEISESVDPVNENTVETNVMHSRLSASAGNHAFKESIPIDRQQKQRETVSVFPEENVVVLTNPRIEIPALLPPIQGFPESESLQLALVDMKSLQNSGFVVENQSDILPLSDKLIGKLGFDDIRLDKIVRSGLDLAVHLTNDKFNYTSDNSGKVTAYHLDTRLLGLSVPVGNRKTNMKEMSSIQ